MSNRHSNTDVNVTDLLANNEALTTLKLLLKADKVTPQFIRQRQELRAIFSTLAATHDDTNKHIHDLKKLLKRHDEKIMGNRNLIDSLQARSASLWEPSTSHQTDNAIPMSRVADLRQTVHFDHTPRLVKIEKMVEQLVHKLEMQDVEHVVGKEEGVEVKDEVME
jgi:hypothetical protein